MCSTVPRLSRLHETKQVRYRLESLVEEVSAHAHDPTPRSSLPGPPIGGAQTGILARPTGEMHKAPLIARVHMRMGIWRWTVTEVGHCMLVYQNLGRSFSCLLLQLSFPAVVFSLFVSFFGCFCSACCRLHINHLRLPVSSLFKFRASTAQHSQQPSEGIQPCI